MQKSADSGIIIEAKRIGNFLRVAAIDTKTMTEVVFQAPLHTSKTEINNLAISKMNYVLSKKQ